MNIAIDIGNSRTKLGLYKDDIFQKLFIVAFEEIEQSIIKLNPESVIISSVSKNTDSLIKKLKKYYEVILFDYRCKIPIINQYKTPETLGNDRLAASVAAVHLYPGKPCLVIDAGTCLTMNSIDKSKNFLGGSISPGLTMRLKAMHRFTSNLPEIDKIEKVDRNGFDTKTSILSGSYYGMLSEINDCIEFYLEKNKDLKVILCGGDAVYFEKKIKHPIFVCPELVLTGLIQIMYHNK